MLYTEIYYKVVLVLEKKSFKYFLPYMAIAAISFIDEEPSNRLLVSLLQKVPCGENWSSGFREKDV